MVSKPCWKLAPSPLELYGAGEFTFWVTSGGVSIYLGELQAAVFELGLWETKFALTTLWGREHKRQ